MLSGFFSLCVNYPPPNKKRNNRYANEIPGTVQSLRAETKSVDTKKNLHRPSHRTAENLK